MICFSFGGIVFMPFGILREPALQDPLLLANDFVNAPETGKGGRPQDGGQHQVVHEKGNTGKKGTGQGHHPPALFSVIILQFDNNRVTDPDNKEHSGSYYDSVYIHLHYSSSTKIQLFVFFTTFDTEKQFVSIDAFII